MRQIADVDNQMLDFLRNHAGFAAAGAGKHEQRPAEVADGFDLLWIEFHMGILTQKGRLKKAGL